MGNEVWNEGMKYEVRKQGDSGYCRLRYKFMRGPLSRQGSYVVGSSFLLHKPNVNEGNDMILGISNKTVKKVCHDEL